MPLKVETMTLISDVIACFRDLFFMLKMSIKKSKFYVWVILKMSLLISSSTKVFLNSGAICKALTLKLSKISMIPSIYLSLKCCYSFCLWSLITV